MGKPSKLSVPLLSGIFLLFLITLFPLIDWIRYRDSKPFVPPIHYTGEVPIRNDSYGNGHFGAPRSRGRTYKGLDIGTPLYSEVIASRGGRVEAGFSKNGLGKYIIIKPPGDYVTIYGHLSKLCEIVRKGEANDLSGNCNRLCGQNG